MSLNNYNRKRIFTNSPEPPPLHHNSVVSPFRFVIQKHRATRLHYDLRLEHKGVLKSWAVPRGPALNPESKRFAVMVEDHPLEYRHFEGIIPEGNYGAGEVIIWDEGSFSVNGCKDRKECENYFEKGLQKGHIQFELSGKKLKGLFHLIKTHGKEEKAWLLIKGKDSFSSNRDILLEEQSVRSDMTIGQLKKAANLSLHRVDQTKLVSLLRDAPQKSFSGPLKPMKATLVNTIFDRQGWYFEIKWDGYRAIAECLGGEVKLYSRNGNSFNELFTPVVKELNSLDFDAVFDGEIVIVDENGKSDFGMLQNYRTTGKGILVYYIFDLIYYKGYDLTGLALHSRKEMLQTIFPSNSNHLKYSKHIETNGKALYKAAQEHQLEGVMAKDSAAPYTPGIRSRLWQKVKIVKQQDMIIGGFTEPAGGRKGLGALILGVYDEGKLKYTGHVGSGFSDKMLGDLRHTLEGKKIEACPFFKTPCKDTNATWVKPELVCVVRFSEWTSDGFMRHPVFLGLREDISPEQTIEEKPQSTKKRFTVKSNQTKTKISGHNLILTNTDKIYFPEDKISKGEIIDYYREIYPWILPHLSERPQSLHRFPDGIYGNHFFHKDMEHLPYWVQSEIITDSESLEATKYLLCQDEASLVYMINLGAIEINPWISRRSSQDYPDYMVIDLDPLECPFSDVVHTALEVHSVLNLIGAPNYIKTSGSKGMHIFVPLEAKYSYDQSRQFAMLICHAVNRQLPATTSMERIPSRRRGKVYLDYLQNLKGKTIASVYSLRPHPGAPVSTPLHWEEVTSTLNPKLFTIKTIFKRLGERGDLWRPVLGAGINMSECLHKLGALIYDVK
ncbi:DNA ligase D [Chitinispirillales bacterium ANBcel5]|uniref:DNA ligase D n=1 Tax=Cellulosispirillum alkaliphilum TaxID=3039283 RepID=UPI002A4E5A95|nr:DNA ligase D [Chitinispirillales bacterium ANBcel5]